MHLQMCVQCVAGFKVDWPESLGSSISWVQTASSTIKIDFMAIPGLGCVWNNVGFYMKFFANMATPVVVALLFAVPVSAAKLNLILSRKIEEEKPDNDLETGPRLDSSKIVWTLKLKHFREVDENYGKYEEQERLKVQRRKVAALSKVEDSDPNQHACLMEEGASEAQKLVRQVLAIKELTSDKIIDKILTWYPAEGSLSSEVQENMPALLKSVADEYSINYLDRYEKTLDAFWNLIMFWFFIIYPSTSQAVLQNFICKPIYKDNFLIASLYTEQCPLGIGGGLEEWTPVAWISLALMFVYPVGIPALLLILMRYNGVPKLAKVKIGTSLVNSMISQLIKDRTSTSSRRLSTFVGLPPAMTYKGEHVKDDDDQRGEFVRRTKVLCNCFM